MTTSWMVGWLVVEVASYSLSCCFALEKIAVRRVGKSSMVRRLEEGQLLCGKVHIWMCEVFRHIRY